MREPEQLAKPSKNASGRKQQTSLPRPASRDQCVEVCFVMDCTGSMARSINACQEKVITIAENIREHCEESMKIRMAFVAYRDYQSGSFLKYDDQGAPEV